MKNIKNLLNEATNNKIILQKSKTTIKAFSLIELSIVLIIMGLLVAGITGGQSLIQSAKIRSFINEANNYKQAINTFYALNGRTPKDSNGDFYSDVSFFRELYDAGILDFKAEDCDGDEECDGINYPKSKAFGTGTFYYNNTEGYDDEYRNRLSLNENFNYLSYDMNYETSSIKTFKQIDEKMDDGIANKGNVIVLGGSENSDYIISDYNDETKKVAEMFFKLDL